MSYLSHMHRSLTVGTTRVLCMPPSLNLATAKKGNGKKKGADKQEAETPAAFVIELHQDWTPPGQDKVSYKKGEFVSTPAHQAAIIRTLIEGGEDEKLAQKIKETKDEQIIVRAKSTVLEPGMDAEAKLRAIIAWVAEAPFNVDTSLAPSGEHIKQLRGELHGNTSAAMAVTLGAKVSPETQGVMEAGIKAQRTADACAPMLAIRLRKDMTAEELSYVPPINSRYRPHQARGESKAPAGYRAPDQSTGPDGVELPMWNGPWDLSETHNTSGAGKEWPTTEWKADFVASTPDGEPWFIRTECLRAIADPKKEFPAEVGGTKVPKELRDELVGEHYNAAGGMQLGGMKGRGDANEIQQALRDSAWEFQKRVNWYGKAFELIQAIDKIENKFKTKDQKVTVQLFGLYSGRTKDLQKAVEMRNPYQLVTTSFNVERGDGTKSDRDVPHMALPPTKILTIAKLAHTVPATTGGGTLQTLRVQRKDPSKDTKADTAHGEGVDGMPPVKTVDGVSKHLRTIVNYLDNEDNMTSLLRAVRTDGALASVAVRVRAALNNLIAEGKSGNTTSAIEKLAQKYEDDAAKAQSQDAA